ncbi:hypothetical protein MCAP1_002472 [Malassezia caprae]|uniref:Purine-cytosine permease fcyB n=1 Tax=Malassezia caprae TaxID=1381934 RepID=A0AAF0IX38_9BASI|nr:hypothetical protein MCAP1_002472 [Malassezia caprae]
MELDKEHNDLNKVDVEVQSFHDGGDTSQRMRWYHPLYWLHSSIFEWSSIEPIPPEKQIHGQWWTVPLLWIGANMNVLTFLTGMLAKDFDISIKGSMYTIVAFSLVTALVPAYFTTFGMNLGVRQIVQSRYSFGYFGACLPGFLVAATQVMYNISNVILGGQTLKAVSPHDSMSSIVGIVILSIIAFVVCFFGGRIMHYFESIFWIPALICFILLASFAGSGANGLHQPAGAPGTTVRGVLGLGCVVAGYFLSWSTIASDMSLYVKRENSATRMFFTVYMAFVLSVAPPFMLGAAFGIAAPDVPAWKNASEATSPGPLFDVILSGHVGSFGKFLTVILALSAVGNIIPGTYAFGIAVQTFLPPLRVLPRFVMTSICVAIFLPLGIVGRNQFYDTLSNFVSVLAYWCSLFGGVVLADHCVFHRRDFSTYDLTIWDDWRRLPPGIAALVSALLPIVVIALSMDQVWYTGPIARHSGDLGFELGFALSFFLYLVLKPIEQRLWR